MDTVYSLSSDDSNNHKKKQMIIFRQREYPDNNVSDNQQLALTTSRKRLYVEMSATIQSTITFTLKIPNTTITVNQTVNVKEETNQAAIKHMDVESFKKMRSKIQETGVDILKKSKQLPVMYIKAVHDTLTTKQ